MGKIKLLLVDDHSIVREGLRMLINSQSDLTVVGEAAEGNEALQKIPILEPDVVIMDLSMPNGRDGLPTISEICQRFPSINILILSMHNDEQSLIRALKAGAKGFLLKSSIGNELFTAIRRVHSGQAYLYPEAQKRVINHMFHRTEEDYQDSFDLLTGREKEVFSLVAKGYTNKEVGTLLNISPRTVENHKSRIMDKLGLKTRKEMIQFALERGLLNK